MLLSRCNAARTRLIDCPGCCVVWIFAKRSCAPNQHAHFPPMLYAEDDHMHVLSVLKSMQDRLEAAERTMEDLVGTIEDLVAAGCGQAAPQGASKAAKGAVQVRVRPRWLPALLSIMQSGLPTERALLCACSRKQSRHPSRPQWRTLPLGATTRTRRTSCPLPQTHLASQ